MHNRRHTVYRYGTHSSAFHDPLAFLAALGALAAYSGVLTAGALALQDAVIHLGKHRCGCFLQLYNTTLVHSVIPLSFTWDGWLMRTKFNFRWSLFHI